MRSIHQQQATCGLQVCQHPLCWDTNRQAARGLLNERHRHTGDAKQIKDQICTERISYEEMDEDILESEDGAYGLPTLTILNMIEDYGISTSDIDICGTVKIDQSLVGEINKSSPAMEKASVIPKLGLKSLASMSMDDMKAPANTPLHSYHDFEGADCHSSDTSHRRFRSHKAKRTNMATKVESPPRKYGKVLLQIGGTNTKGLVPKKMLVWCPSLQSKRQQVLETLRAKQSSMKRVNLPLQSVPEYNLTLMSHKAIKGMVCKKNRQSNAPKLKGIQDIVSVSQPGQASRITPQEIELLRRVPLDVLIRVLNQAEENKVITKAQSRFLLTQVGQKVQLPPIASKNTTETVVGDTKDQKTGEDNTRAALKPNPLNILDLAYSQGNGERIASAGPGIRADAATTIKASDLTPSRTAPPSTRVLAEYSQYDKKLRSIADENLKNLQSLISERTCRKRTPVKYIATLFDEDPQKSFVKPFHYKQSTRDLFLGPIPSPPPPSPPTERDSLYDPQIGGSTVMVNPSLNEPSTITSIDEKRLSPRQSKTPLSAIDGDARNRKMIQASGSQIHGISATSPFDSSNGGDGWPQINEDDFLEAVSSDYMSSPIPSFLENEIRSLSRNDSTKPVNEDEQLPDEFQNLNRDETKSPIPPPPSPEPVAGNEQPMQDTAEETRRIMGAATALGLTTLTTQTSIETTPDMETGVTTTPVVSSVSGKENHSREATASFAAEYTSIAETPHESELENEEKRILADQPTVNASQFEENISPEVARAELEEEVKKLELS